MKRVLISVCFALLVTVSSCELKKFSPVDDEKTDSEFSDDDIIETDLSDEESFEYDFSENDEDADFPDSIITITKNTLEKIPDESSDPYSYTKVKNGVLFFAFEEATGFEPWITDGTETGTRLLMDICPGTISSYPRLISNDKERTVFYACGMIWISDGSVEGTEILKNSGDKKKSFFRNHDLSLDIKSIDFNDYILAAIPIYETDYFNYWITDLHWKLLLIDKDKKSFAVLLEVDYFENFLGIKNNQVLFLAGNNDSKLHLWSSGLTKENTKKVIEIFSLPEEYPQYYAGHLIAGPVDTGKITFTAVNPYDEKQIIKFVVTDGTFDGTDIYELSIVSSYYMINYLVNTEKTIFALNERGDFFKFDPLSGELTKLFNSYTQFACSPLNVVSYSDSFFVLCGDSQNYKIIKYDESADSSSVFYDFAEPVFSMIPPVFFKDKQNLCFVDSEKYRSFSTITFYNDILHIYNTEDKNKRIISLNTYNNIESDSYYLKRGTQFTFIDDKIFFSGREGVFYRSSGYYFLGSEPKIVLKDSVEAVMIKNINTDVTTYYSVSPVTFFANRLFFNMDDDPNTIPFLNVTDSGVNKVETSYSFSTTQAFLFNNNLYLNSINKGVYRFNDNDLSIDTISKYGASSFFPLKDIFFLTVYDSEHGNELWKVDKNSNVAEFFKDLYPGVAGSSPSEKFASIDNKMVFNAQSGLEGYEPHFTDGTPENTVLLVDAFEGYSSSEMLLTQTYKNSFYFVLRNNNIIKIYRTDGKNTDFLGEINISTDGYPRIMEVNDKSVLMITESDKGTFVYSSGHNENKLLKTFDINTVFVFRNSYVKIGNNIFFLTGSNYSNREVELWKTDGTKEQTVKIKNLFLDQNPYFENRMIAHKGKLLFAASDGIYGNELWISDGTEKGTKMIKDIMKGQGQSNPVFIAEHKNNVYFTASDGTHGYEIWQTDGTSEGTYMVYDLYAGRGSSSIESLFFTENDDLVVKSFDRKDGYQIRKIPFVVTMTKSAK